MIKESRQRRRFPCEAARNDHCRIAPDLIGAARALREEGIDINRFSFRSKPITGFWQAVNLMTPFHEPEELKPFVEAYEQAAHCPGKLVGRVLFFRRWRTRYSRLKKILKKIPGAKRVSKHRV